MPVEHYLFLGTVLLLCVLVVRWEQKEKRKEKEEWDKKDKKISERAKKLKAEREARNARSPIMAEISELNNTAEKLWKEGRYYESIEARKKQLAKWKECERFIPDDDDLRLKEARGWISKLEAIVADPKY